MWKRFSVLAAVLLLRLSEVASRPVPDTPHQQFARSGVGDDDGWPRVEGGWHKGCTTSNRPKPTATPVTVYEEVTITQVATVTMTVDSTVVVTDYVDVTVSLFMAQVIIYTE